MTTPLDFAIVIVPLTLAMLVLLSLGRRHIHGQMEQIAAAAKARAAAHCKRLVASNAAKACVSEAPRPLAKLQMQDAMAQTV